MSGVLLVDTNFSAAPIHKYLVEAGYKVTVVGGKPSDSLAKTACDYVCLDYSDIEKMRGLLNERNFDYLVPGCNDRSYMVCAKLNVGRRFPGLDPVQTAEVINNKARFREFCAAHGLPAPKVVSWSEIDDNIPVIIKPVDSYSGRGVSILHSDNKAALEAAKKLAQAESKTGEAIAEEYISGQLYSHSAFVAGGKIVSDHVVEEHGTVNPFVVDTSRVAVEFPERLLRRLRATISLIASELDLQDGLIHTQFIAKGESYWLIEVTRRCPGDLYSQLIELTTAEKYVANYVRPYIGKPVVPQKNRERNLVIRHTITQPQKFELDSLVFNEAPKFVKWVALSVTGDRLRESPHGRVAVFFTESKTLDDFDSLWNKTLSRDLYIVNSR